MSRTRARCRQSKLSRQATNPRTPSALGRRGGGGSRRRERWLCRLAALLLLTAPGWAQQASPAPASPAPAQTPVPAAVKTALTAFKVAIQGWRQQQQRQETGFGLLSQFHGSLYEYFRNNALDAIPHEVHQGGGTASSLRRNQFGFTLTGPLPFGPPSDRNTHLSVAFEGTREIIDRAFLGTVPTLAERTGNFADLVDSSGNSIPIYNPATTQLNPAYDSSQPVSTSNLQYLRDQFPHNLIPPAMLDPVALKMLTLYPAPNANVGPYLTNNFFANAPARNTATGAIVTLDHDFSSRHHLALRLSDSVGLHQQPSVFGNDASPGQTSQSFVSRGGTLTDSWNLSDSTVNQFYVRWDDNLQRSLDATTQDWPQWLGLFGIASSQFPIINLNGAYVPMGRYNSIWDDDVHDIELEERLSVHDGSHTWSFGVHLSQSRLHSFEAGSPAGNFQFSGLQTSLPGINDTGSPLAQLLLGDVSSMHASLVPFPMDYRQNIGMFQFQDRYQMFRGLDWTLGLTVKVDGPRRESQNRLSTFDPRVLNPATGQLGAMVFGAAWWQPVRAVFEPQVGLAWNPFPSAQTVVRAGYSLGYQDYRLSGESFGAIGYTLEPQYTSPNDQLTPAFQLRQDVPQIYPAPPDLSPVVANGQHTQYLDPSGTLPMHQYWQFQMEQPLSSSLTMRLGYNGILATHQFAGAAVDLNPLPPGALRYGNQLYDQAFNQNLRPYPQYTEIDTGGNYAWGTGTYQAATVDLQDRFTGGLMFQATYTWSKALDNYSGSHGPQNSADLAAEKAISPYSRSRVLGLNFLYELPVGGDGRWLNSNGPLNWLLSDWSLNGFITLQNGFPLVIHPMFNNTGGVADTLRVNVVPGVDPRVAQPSAALWFNPAAFAQPADFTFGNASRTSPTLRSPGQRLADLSLSRDVALSESRTLQIFVEGFNALNHANLNPPDTVIGPASSPNLHAGKITGSNGGRVVQLGLRLEF